MELSMLPGWSQEVWVLMSHGTAWIAQRQASQTDSDLERPFDGREVSLAYWVLHHSRSGRLLVWLIKFGSLTLAICALSGLNRSQGRP